MVKVLVVDDDDDIRETLVDVIRARGYEVSGASNGRDALEIAERIHPDLLITDIIMPDKDGIQMILEARKRFGNIPVIAMSGGGRIPASVYLSHARAMGEMRTLEKPFKVSTLLEAVNEAVGGR